MKYIVTFWLTGYMFTAGAVAARLRHAKPSDGALLVAASMVAWPAVLGAMAFYEGAK
jgi:hypothetical protein